MRSGRGLRCSLASFFLDCYSAPRDLHSFPTRRSSDLCAGEGGEENESRGLASGHRAREALDVGHGGQSRSPSPGRSEEHTSELQSLTNLVCRLLLEKKNSTIFRPCRSFTGSSAGNIGS